MDFAMRGVSMMIGGEEVREGERRREGFTTRLACEDECVIDRYIDRSRLR